VPISLPQTETLPISRSLSVQLMKIIVMPFATKRGKTRGRNATHIVLLASVVLLVIWTRLGAGNQPSEQIDSNTASRRIHGLVNDTRPSVAIVSCITSHTDRFRYGTDQLMREKLLPSVYATISNEERAEYRVEVIFGYDEDDLYWKQRSNQDVIQKLLDDTAQHIPVSFISLKNDRPNHIPFNQLCQYAYEVGIKYLVRINDDTHFITPGWLTLAINTLQSFTPPNVGVVGPKAMGDASTDREIMTHDMTYLPFHLAIFGTYYPEVFDNWYIDDWISRVYSEDRTRKLNEWKVIHNQAYGTRYTPSTDQKALLDDQVEKGRQKVSSFIKTYNLVGKVRSHEERRTDR
jgi:hypothetical protein